MGSFLGKTIIEWVFIAIFSVLFVRAVQELIEYIKYVWNSLINFLRFLKKSIRKLREKYFWKIFGNYIRKLFRKSIRKHKWENEWEHKPEYGWSSWKILENLWLGRNFDFWASLSSFAVVSILLEMKYFSFDIDVSEEKFAGDLLFLGALIGFPILIKRVSEVQKQTRTMQYNAANELLWSERLGSRMAGIDALWRVAQTYPKEEYKNVMDVFSQFIKHPPSYEWEEGTKKENKKAGKRPDIVAILLHMGEERVAGAAPHKIDLRFSNLEGADLVGANLKGARLYSANLKGVDLRFSNLEGVDLRFSNLEGVDLRDANLEGVDLRVAHLEGANLSGAHLEEADLWRDHLGGANLQNANLKLATINNTDFTDANNLTQGQIKECVFITNHPRFKEKPQLPKGRKHTYEELSLKEWKKEIDKYLSPLYDDDA